MKSPNPTTARQETHDQQTGLPGLTTWPKVYWLVAASFVLWVVLLYVLIQMFA